MKRMAWGLAVGLALGLAGGFAYARDGNRGCCSHHKGVCGCNKKAHALICCDDSLSPSCGC
jgi:hypothetical protein